MLAIEATMNVLGKGVYTIAEAARLTRLRPARVREWFRGRESPSRIFTPIFQSDYPVIHEEYAISFLDLIELNIGGKLREAGISLPKLRVNYHELRKEFGSHPFCTRQIYVRGKQVFTSRLNEEERGSVIEAMTKQMYFDKIILPFLKEIDYGKAKQRSKRIGGISRTWWLLIRRFDLESQSSKALA